MLDLSSIPLCICCLIQWYCVSVVCRRPSETDGTTCPWFISNQFRLFKRYLLLASDRHWSRVPVFVACTALFCGLISFVIFTVQLVSHGIK